ncbi:MAG: hypothetical protein ACREQN_11120 [Candidatus Binataceae bacterium]
MAAQMTDFDQMFAKQEATGTFWPNAANLVAAIRFLPLPAYYPTTSILTKRPLESVECGYADSTCQATAISTGVDYVGIFQQIDRIYDYLLSDPAELDEDAHKILYSKLWDLYQ